jgi:hypothetical protein
MIKQYSVIQVDANSIWNPWGSKANKLILNDQEREDYIKQINKILSQPKNLNFGKTIYTSSLSSIQRFKFKEYIASKKLKRTSRQEYCDTIIVDKTIFNSTLKFLNKLSKSNIIRNVQDEKLYNDFAKYVRNNNINCRPNLPLLQQNLLVILPNDINVVHNKDAKHFIQNNYVEQVYYYSLYREKNIENVILLLDFLKIHPNVNIIFDEYLLEELNSGGIDLDKEYIDTLENMFNSNQNDNIKLAIEMLSNVNLEKNSLTIALLLNKYQRVFDHGKGITPSSMSSFKTIDKYYKSRGIVWKTDWRPFSNGLYKNYGTDPEYKAVIENFVLKNINDILKTGSQFKIESFNLAFQA